MKQRRDNFMQDMSRIQRARQLRRAQRENEHLLDEETSLWQAKRGNFQDGLKFSTQEFGALGKEVARGVAREGRNVGKGILKEGTDLAVDLLVSMATLGLAGPTVTTKRNSRRRRRRR